MSLTNLCSCALIKDHKMRQIINDLLPNILKNYEFGIISTDAPGCISGIPTTACMYISAFIYRDYLKNMGQGNLQQDGAFGGSNILK